MSIIPQQTEIDADAALDLIGRGFNFNHAKGIAEWLKNSYDAYATENISSTEQKIIIYLTLGGNDIVNKIDVIDFCGMTKAKIEKGFIQWFSIISAQLNKSGMKTNINTLGGHGNGGKFYMRQMFDKSFLITYTNNYLNIFGFNEKKQYGFKKGYEDRKADVLNALKIAGINIGILDNNILDNLKKGTCGFTVVRGIKLKKPQGNVYKRKLLEKVISNPQARAIIKYSNVYFASNKSSRYIKLNIESIEPRPGFDHVTVTCPTTIKTLDGEISIVNDRYPKPPTLTLKTSNKPLKGLHYKELNRIDFLGENGIIASYPIIELGHFTSGYTEFIYGECECPILEDKENSHVTNERERFVSSDMSNAIIHWVQKEITKLTEKMLEEQKAHKRKYDLSKTSDLNKILNTWKNQFLKTILKDQLFGEGNEPGIGGDNDEGPIMGSQKGKNTGKKAKKKKGSSGGDTTRKASGYPEVLISGRDEDPMFGDGRTFECDERHHAVHQRPWDLANNIYWINTSKPIAGRILDLYGPESPRWRNYLFQMYTDIIIKEAIFIMGKRDILTSDDVNNKIDDIISTIQEKAISDLDNFLFSEKYKV
ncbi:MAG: hypothetical protein H8E55_47550 [Pelagibacterales bacterium]|nr:hypothetical protein [Pelagibacterales bacterium]